MHPITCLSYWNTEYAWMSNELWIECHVDKSIYCNFTRLVMYWSESKQSTGTVPLSFWWISGTLSAACFTLNKSVNNATGETLIPSHLKRALLLGFSKIMCRQNSWTILFDWLIKCFITLIPTPKSLPYYLIKNLFYCSEVVCSASEYLAAVQ